MKHWIRFATTMVVTLGVLACAEPAQDEPASDETGLETETEVSGEEESPRDVYAIRGEIATLPTPDDVQSQFSVKHEAIDDFKGIGGEIWGMDSMTMPFAIAEDVSLDGLAAGDKIRFSLAVDWFGDPPQEIVSIEKLPDETELEFRPARSADAEDQEDSPEG